MTGTPIVLLQRDSAPVPPPSIADTSMGLDRRSLSPGFWESGMRKVTRGDTRVFDRLEDYARAGPDALAGSFLLLHDPNDGKPSGYHSGIWKKTAEVILASEDVGCLLMLPYSATPTRDAPRSFEGNILVGLKLFCWCHVTAKYGPQVPQGHGCQSPCCAYHPFPEASPTPLRTCKYPQYGLVPETEVTHTFYQEYLALGRVSGLPSMEQLIAMKVRPHPVKADARIFSEQPTQSMRNEAYNLVMTA